MTIDEMRARKKELGYSYQQLSELSGVPLGTVQKVMGKITKSPRYDTIRALEEVLRREPGVYSAVTAASCEDERSPVSAGKETVSGDGKQPERIRADRRGIEYASLLRDGGIAYGASAKAEQSKEKVKGDACNVDLISETAPEYARVQDIKAESETKWDRQGEYTLEDYYALPDEKRVELIDGVFYDMASPTEMHQILVGEIYFAFSEYIKKNKGNCIPIVSPADVQLDRNNRTMVQPDVMILCKRDKLKNRAVDGAPDLVVEILSKSTRNKDLLIKLNKYYNAGVREYWIVDLKNRQVIVYTFENGVELHMYDAESVVPVGIFGGECRVDFGAIFDFVSFLGDAE